MIVKMKENSTSEQIKSAIEKMKDLGLKTWFIKDTKSIIVSNIKKSEFEDFNIIEQLPGVESITPLTKPFKLVSREAKRKNTVINIGNVTIGDGSVTVMSGPCAVENKEQLMSAARSVKKAGGHVLRGGAFKPRTSPYSFQGLEKKGLMLIKEASMESGLPAVSEIMDEYSLNLAYDYIDIFQIGARNMHNFRLLKQVGKTDKPVLLKRGLSATIEEWLMAAEYIMSEGNDKIILCERGIRTYEKYTRNTLDLSAVALAKKLSHLPVIVDPSHATGNRSLVLPMSLAAVAAGADGLLIEMHPNPEIALCDGEQSLTPDGLSELMEHLGRMLPSIGRWMSPSYKEIVNC